MSEVSSTTSSCKNRFSNKLAQKVRSSYDLESASSCSALSRFSNRVLSASGLRASAALPKSKLLAPSSDEYQTFEGQGLQG